MWTSFGCLKEYSERCIPLFLYNDCVFVALDLHESRYMTIFLDVESFNLDFVIYEFSDI